MRLAMHNWMRPESLETTLQRLSRHGYDAIEISGEPERYPIEETRALLAKYNVACWGSVSIMTEGRDLIHADRYVRIGTIAYLKDCVRLVHDLGGEMLAVVPSTVGKTVPMASAEQEWQWAVDGLREVADEAGQLGVRIGIEPINRFETYFINRADQALCLADAVGPNVGVALDAFHLNIEDQDPLAAIRGAGARLFDFHVADSNRRVPGDGHVDWAGAIAAMQAIGYEGCLTAEFVLPLDRTPLAGFGSDPDGDDASEGSASDLKFIQDHGSGVLSDAVYDEAVGSTADYLRSLIGRQSQAI